VSEHHDFFGGDSPKAAVLCCISESYSYFWLVSFRRNNTLDVIAAWEENDPMRDERIISINEEEGFKDMETQRHRHKL
jgi:hypothetical protein